MLTEYLEIKKEGGLLHLVIPGAAQLEQTQAEDFAEPWRFVVHNFDVIETDETEPNTSFVKAAKLIRFVISELDEEGLGIKRFGRTCSWNHAHELPLDSCLEKLSQDIKTIYQGTLADIHALVKPEYFLFTLNTASTLFGQLIDSVLQEDGLGTTTENRLQLFHQIQQEFRVII